MAYPHPRITELLADGLVSPRPDIVRLLQVAPPTASAQAGQLIGAGVMVEGGLAASGGGRPRRRLRLNRPPGHPLMTELDGNHTRFRVTDRTGQLLHFTTSPLMVADGPEQVFGFFATLLRDQPVEGELAGAELALSSPVQPGGTVQLPSRVPGWVGFPVQEAPTESFGVPTMVESDTSAMAPGEHRTQLGSEGDSITVKAGMATGSGIVTAGQFYRGAIFTAGGVTHTMVHAVGNRSRTCEKINCLEMVVSGAGIVTRPVEQEIKITNTADVLVLARDDDPGIATMVRTAGFLLNGVFSSVVSFLNPRVLSLTGGLASSQYFVTVVRAHIYDGCHPLMMESLRIEAALLGTDTTLAGTVLLTATAIHDAALWAGVMLTGIHVDMDTAIVQAVALGANIAQMTFDDPQSRKKSTVPSDGATTLRSRAENAGIGLCVHIAYVINVASTNNRVRIPSRRLSQRATDAAAGIGANGVIVRDGHVAAGEDQRRGYGNWHRCVNDLDLKVPILIENTVDGRKAMMRHLRSIRDLWVAFDGFDNLGGINPYLDIRHTHITGLGLTTVVEDVRATINRIDLVHCSDSHDATGSERDRHAPLGRDQFDPKVFVTPLRDTDTPAMPETPPENRAGEIAWLREQLG